MLGGCCGCLLLLLVDVEERVRESDKARERREKKNTKLQYLCIYALLL